MVRQVRGGAAGQECGAVTRHRPVGATSPYPWALLQLWTDGSRLFLVFDLLDSAVLRRNVPPRVLSRGGRHSARFVVPINVLGTLATLLCRLSYDLAMSTSSPRSSNLAPCTHSCAHPCTPHRQLQPRCGCRLSGPLPRVPLALPLMEAAFPQPSSGPWQPFRLLRPSCA